MLIIPQTGALVMTAIPLARVKRPRYWPQYLLFRLWLPALPYEHVYADEPSINKYFIINNVTSEICVIKLHNHKKLKTLTRNTNVVTCAVGINIGKGDICSNSCETEGKWNSGTDLIFDAAVSSRSPDARWIAKR